MSYLRELFATPLSEQKWTDVDAMNRELLGLIEARQVREPGIIKSNVGGWHSTTDLLQWGGAAVAELRTGIGRAVKCFVAHERGIAFDSFSLELGLDVWANWMPAGAWHKPHAHPNANISGVYYLVTGDDGGELVLLDPRGPAMYETPGTNRVDRVTIQPSVGLLVLFPASVLHYVTPLVEGTRVSISFNITVTKLTRRDAPG